MTHAFTIVRDEGFWLPIWVKHYMAQGFSASELTVLNNGGPITGLDERINIIEVPNPASFQHEWLKQTVMAQQRLLLRTNHAVVFAECDEFLFHSDMNIYQLCQSLQQGESVRATAYSPIQQPGEAAYVDGPLLANRSIMYRTTMYDKVLVTTVPLSYCRGFHIAQENQRPPDHRLSMVHMWMFDFDQFWQRILDRRAAGSKGFFGADMIEMEARQHFADGFATFVGGYAKKPGDLMTELQLIPDLFRSL